MQQCKLLFCVATALLLCCGFFQQSSAEEFYDAGNSDEPLNFPPNNTPPSAEPSFCTNKEEDCKLDTVNGVQLIAKWTVKVDLKKTSFSVKGRWIIHNAPQRGGELTGNATVDDSTSGIENRGNTAEPYALITVTTTCDFKIDDSEEGESGDVVLELIASTNGEKSKTWAFGHEFEVGETST